MSAAWLFVLSWWLGVTPGAPVVTRNNVLFQVDVASHYRELTRESDPFSPGKPRISLPHPFLPQVWGNIGKTLAAACQRVVDADTAHVLAARILVASTAATGLAALGWLASIEGVPGLWLLCLVVIAWLSSAMTIVALPDHFGLSYGLLLITFVGGWASVTRHRHGWWAGLAGSLAVATTSTNIVLVGMIGGWMAWRPARRIWAERRRHRALLAAIAIVALVLTGALVVVAPAAARRVASGETIVSKYFHATLVHAPGTALVSLPLTWTYPTVAAAPHVADAGDGACATLEPWRFGDYTPLGGLGALLVFALTIAAVARLARGGAAGQSAFVLTAWVAFNWLFHSLWGDERFLYTPHWAWVLPVTLALSADRGRVPKWFYVAAVLVAAAEIASLATIIGLARSIR